LIRAAPSARQLLGDDSTEGGDERQHLKAIDVTPLLVPYSSGVWTLNPSTMTLLLAAAAGIVLAASAGLRAFMPLFAAGLASRTLDWQLASSMQWLSSDFALVGLGVAMIAEVIADKIPVVDHVLDAIHTVVGPLAGALVAFSAWFPMPPVVAIVLALLVGAPVAGGVHLLAATTRVKSTLATGGALNPVASTAEDGLSIGAILIALLAPILALVLAIVIMVVVFRFVARRARRQGAVESVTSSGMEP
jgi:uncharacterized protein DUF4126